MLSFLAILTRLIVELPFAVRVEDGTPVSTKSNKWHTIQVVHPLLKEKLRNFSELKH